MVVADKYAAFAHQHSLGIVFLCIGHYFIFTFRYKQVLTTLRTGFLGVESHASSQGIRQVAFSSTNILVHICTLPTIETCFNCIGTRSSNANKRIKTTKKFRQNFKVGGSRQNGASA